MPAVTAQKAVSKFIKETDMNFNNPFADMFKNSIDMNQVITTQRKNLEAASEASQVVVESTQAIARRQSEIARENVEQALKASKDLFTGNSPETNVAKQVEFAKSAFENSLANLREISEMMAKSAFEAFDVVNRRVAESFEEVSSGAAAKPAKKKSA
jgi:phasin family protein